MNVALWIVQVLLALMFGMGGAMKLFTPIEELAAQMPWAGMVPVWMVRTPGIAEMLAAVGLILPAATRVQPKLTPYAAIGLVVIMVLAAATHLKLGQPEALPVNAFLGALAAFVAWGRLKARPILPKA